MAYVLANYVHIRFNIGWYVLCRQVDLMQHLLLLPRDVGWRSCCPERSRAVRPSSGGHRKTAPHLRRYCKESKEPI
jgi:hypothetical protein